EELEDPGAGCSITTGPEVTRYEYHVVYSSSYQSPVLYFRACKLDGRPLSLEEIWESVHDNYKDRLLQGPWDTITQQHRLYEELEDPGAGCSITTGPEVTRYEYHVVYSSSYQSPVLYFRACKLDGRPLSLEEIWESVHDNYKDRLLQGPWDTITQQHRLYEELEDPGAGCSITTGPEVTRYEYHVVYSSSYQSPVLYFRACKLDGRPLSLEEIWESVHDNYKDRLLQGPWDTITQQVIPEALLTVWCCFRYAVHITLPYLHGIDMKIFFLNYVHVNRMACRGDIRPETQTQYKNWRGKTEVQRRSACLLNKNTNKRFKQTQNYTNKEVRWPNK
ncbi:UNVERIFIED_CONTAM: hypothetical protein FKN15_070549, partial [Acipenser sinensis]